VLGDERMEAEKPGDVIDAIGRDAGDVDPQAGTAVGSTPLELGDSLTVVKVSVDEPCHPKAIAIGGVGRPVGLVVRGGTCRLVDEQLPGGMRRRCRGLVVF